MGIQDRDGALFFATGVDNTGLYSGRREAIGIIKAMTSEITSFDVFGGIGISAGIAFAQAAKGAYDFEKQFQQSMKEVATLSSGIKGSLTDYMNQVMDVTREIPVLANDAAKALYQIVSAGHDGADGMKVLEVSAKAAIGGVTETATAADTITTVLNAYKMSASEAQRVSDLLFTAVKLGKTTFGELGQSIAQAAPIAASYGVEIDQVLAAVASLTKQGTPTAQAMTQIRASIIGVSKVLGDGAFNGRTYQEALEEVARQAGGSESKLRELVPEVEAVNAVLGMTGKNANATASDLEQMGSSIGAAEAAFKEMVSSAENQLQILQNNITASLRPMGEAILKEVSEIASSFNEAFANGDIQESMKTLGDLIVVVTSAFVGYKGSIIAVTAAKTAYHAITTWITKQKSIEAANLVLTKGLYAAEATMIAKNTGMHVLLTNALKAQFAAAVKATGAMLANPYALAAIAVAALGYAVYSYATRATAAEKAQRRFNNAMKEGQQQAEDYKKTIDDLVSTARNESVATVERYKALLQLQRLMPSVFKDMDLQKLKSMDQLELTNKTAEAEARRNIVIAKTNEVLRQNELNSINSRLNKTVKQQTESPSGQKAAVIQKLQEEKQIAEESVRLAKVEVQKVQEIQVQATKAEAQAKAQAAIQNKAHWEKQRDDAVKALDSIASAQKKQMDVGNFKGIDSAVVTAYKDNAKKLKEAEKELKVYGDSSKQEDKAETLRKETEKYKLLLDEQKREQERMEVDSAYELEQVEINALQEGSEKILRQRELNHKKELDAISREAEEKKAKAIEKARAEFESNPENKKQSFDVNSFMGLQSTKELFAMFDKLADEKTKTVDVKYNRGDDLAGLLDEYQDYTDQRLAIETKFNNDLAILEKQKEAAEKKGDTKQVEKIDRAKTQAIKEKGKSLMALDYEQLKKSPEYVRAFENLKETSTETLTSLLEQLENAKQSAAEVLSPDQLREYTTTIQEVMNELDSRNPFQTLANRKKELALAEKELAEAKKNLDTVNSGGKVVAGTSLNKETGKIEKQYLSSAEALEKYNAAQNKTVKASAKVQDAEKEVNDVMGELFDSIKNVGNTIGGQAGEIISLIGEIGEFAMMAMNGIETASQTASSAVKAVENASVILAIISAAIQVATKIASMFSSNDAEERRQYIEQLNAVADIYDKIIDKQKESIKFGYGFAAIEAAKKAMEDLNKQTEQYRKIAESAGQEKGKGALSYKYWDEYKKILEKFNIHGSGSKLGGVDTGGLATLTGKQLEEIRESYIEIWAALPEEQQKALEAIIEAEEKGKDIIEEWQEAITGISYDSFYTDFINMLSDMDTSAEDMAENFGEYLRKSILAAMVAKNYQSKIGELYEMWVSAGDKDSEKGPEISKDEAAAIQKKYQDLVEEMTQARDNMSEAFGWTKEDTDDSIKNYEDFASQMQGTLTSLELTSKDVSDNIYQYMRQAMINALYDKEYKSKMEELYKTFEDLSADGLSESDMAQLGSQVDQYIEQMMKGVEDVNSLFADKLKDAEDVQSFVDNVKSAMSSIEATAEDVTDNIFEYIRQQMVEKMFADTFQPQIEEFYKKVQEAMSDGSVTDSERDALRTEAEKLANDIVAAKDILSDTLGITSKNLQKELEEEFKSFSDGILNSLYNAEVTAESVAKDIADSMRKELIEAMYIEQYEPRIKAIWEKWKEYSSDGLVTDEERANIKSDIDELGKEVADAAKEISDAWIDAGEEVDEAFESFSDSIKNVLYDAEATAEDVANNIYQYMRNALVDSMFTEQLKPQIQAWYDKYTEFMEDGSIDTVERKTLDEMIAEIQKAGVDIVDAANALFPSLDTGAIKRAEEAAQEAENARNEAEQEWESFSDSILDSLYDIEATAEDISDDMGEYMRKALIKAMYVENFKPQMQKWYNEWQRAMGDGDLTSEEKQTLDSMKQAMVDDMKKEVDAINQFFETSFSQKASSRSAETITQDTGEEISGRLTGVYESSEGIRNEAIVTNSWLAMIYSAMGVQGFRQSDLSQFTLTNTTASGSEQAAIGIQGDMLRRLEDIYRFNAEVYDEYGNMMLSVIDHLENIHKNTNSLPRMEKMLEDIKRSSAELAGR